MADQLWVVFLDGVAQEGVLPYAGSEENALSRWREQTGRRRIARARLRAVPKAEDRAAAALTIVRDIAHRLRDEDADVNGADFIDDVYGELDEAGFITEVRAASSPRPRKIPKKDPALAIVQNIALVFRDEHTEVNGADFINDVSGMLDAAGFLAEARASAEADEGLCVYCDHPLGEDDTVELASGRRAHADCQKAALGIDEADVPDSPGAGVRREPIPSSRPGVLTTEEQAALRAWANEEGPRWKAALRRAWETGNYGGSEHDAALQRIRNRLGPSWLVKYRLLVDPSDETKDYHCWVVTSRNPHQTRGWVATRRAEAVSQVKAAVRNHRTEGGVESRDPKRPFEATFSLVRGKLVTTKFTD